MANFGRFVCVAIPFALTLASLIAMLLAGLAGIADKSLYMFRVNVTELSMDPLSAANIVNGVGINIPDSVNLTDITGGNVDLPDGLDKIDIPGFSKREDVSKTTNITAKDLGLYDIYDVNIWNFCYTPNNGSRECKKASFNWATKELNTSTGDFEFLTTEAGVNVTLPKELKDAIKLFGNVSRWTQIVFIVAYIALGVELFFGLFTGFSRVFSCITWLVAFVASAATIAAAALATATSVVVVGAVEGTAKIYNGDAHFNTRFLATVWIGAAFAIAAGMFWLFSACCCAPDHSSRSSRSRGGESEKFIAGGGETGYSRLSEPNGYNGAGAGAGGGYAQSYNRQSYGAPPQHSGAYEPYSHARV